MVVVYITCYSYSWTTWRPLEYKGITLSEVQAYTNRHAIWRQGVANFLLLQHGSGRKKFTFSFKNLRLCLETLTTSKLYATGIIIFHKVIFGCTVNTNWWECWWGIVWCFNSVQTCQVLFDIHLPQECLVFITIIHFREVGHYTSACVTCLTDDNLKVRNLCMLQFTCWIDYSRILALFTNKHFLNIWRILLWETKWHIVSFGCLFLCKWRLVLVTVGVPYTFSNGK